jgi:hypothetical protein
LVSLTKNHKNLCSLNEFIDIEKRDRLEEACAWYRKRYSVAQLHESLSAFVKEYNVGKLGKGGTHKLMTPSITGINRAFGLRSDGLSLAKLREIEIVFDKYLENYALDRAFDFSEKTKEILESRAGGVCSNPDHRILTKYADPNDPEAYISIGVVHPIEKPEKDQTRPEKGFNRISNGIWLCANCDIMIRRNPDKYSVERLRRWKEAHEKMARNFQISIPSSNSFSGSASQLAACQRLLDFLSPIDILFLKPNANTPSIPGRKLVAQTTRINSFLTALQTEVPTRSPANIIARAMQKVTGQYLDVLKNEKRPQDRLLGLGVMKKGLGIGLVLIKNYYRIPITGKLATLIPKT